MTHVWCMLPLLNPYYSRSKYFWKVKKWGSKTIIVEIKTFSSSFKSEILHVAYFTILNSIDKFIHPWWLIVIAYIICYETIHMKNLICIKYCSPCLPNCLRRHSKSQYFFHITVSLFFPASYWTVWPWTASQNSLDWREAILIITVAVIINTTTNYYALL